MENDVYKKKITELLDSIHIKKEDPLPIKETEEDLKWKKVQEIGGVKKAIPEIFKIEESIFDVPSFITEEEEEISGTPYKNISSESSNTDAINYWNELQDDLRKMSKIVPFTSFSKNKIQLLVDKDGNDKKLTIKVVSDSENGDKPTLMFQLEDGEIEIEDIIPLLNRVGLKLDRMSVKKYPGILTADVTK